MSVWVAVCLLILAAVVSTLLLLRLLRSHSVTQKADEQTPAPLDIAALVLRLSDQQDGESSRNRLLSLGPNILPELLSQLVYHRFHIEDVPKGLLAELEELIADFGPKALPFIMQRMHRWEPSHRCAPSMIRIIKSLGEDSIEHFIDNRNTDMESPRRTDRFLPHLLLDRSDARTCPLLIRDVSRRPDDALLVTIQSREWATLWLRLCREGQLSLLNWFEQWPNCLDADFLEFLLLQADADQIPQILKLIALHPSPKLFELVCDWCSHDKHEIRVAAIRTRTYYQPRNDAPYFASLLKAANRTVRIWGLRGLLLSGQAIENIAGVRETICRDLLWIDKNQKDVIGEQIFKALGRTDAHLEMDARVTLAMIYPHFVKTPAIASERLLQLSDSFTAEIRLAVTLALTLTNDPRSQEALKRCIHLPIPNELAYVLQMATCAIGASVARLLANRLFARSPNAVATDRSLVIRSVGHILLRLLRSIPFASATDLLLELIEADGQTQLGREFALTLKSGGKPICRELARALNQPERGLILPTVRYLSLCPDARLLEDLMKVQSDFDLVRNQTLTVVEYLGRDGLVAIENAIELGGHDDELETLIETESWLSHCLLTDDSQR